MTTSIDINTTQQTITARRSLRASGSSTVLTVPPEILQSLDWQQGDTVEIQADWDAGEVTLSLK